MTMTVLRADLNSGPRRRKVAAVNLAEAHLIVFDPQQFQLIDQLMWISAGADERAQNHVTARTGRAVEIQRPQLFLRLSHRPYVTQTVSLRKLGFLSSPVSAN